MDYLRLLLLGRTLCGQYLESEHLLRSVLEKRRVCLFHEFVKCQLPSSEELNDSNAKPRLPTGSGEPAITENLLHLAPGSDHP